MPGSLGRIAVVIVAATVPGWLVYAVPTGRPIVAPRLDLHGDPLPPDAITRLGTLRFRGEFANAPDGKSLAVLRGNRVLYVDPETCAEQRRLPGPDVRAFEVSAFLLSADGCMVAYSGEAGIEIWDVVTAKRIIHLKHPAEIGHGTFGLFLRPMAFSRDGHRLIAFGHHGETTTICWDIQSGAILWQTRAALGDHWQSVRPLGLNSKTGQLIAVREVNHEYQLWLMNEFSGSLDRALMLGRANESTYALSPDGTHFAFATENRVRRFELPSAQELPAISNRFGQNVEAMAFSPDNQSLALADYSGVRIFDTNTQQERGRSNGRSIESGPDLRLRFSADGQTLWLTSHLHAWSSYDGKNGRERPKKDVGHRGGLDAVAINSVGTQVATSGHGEIIRHWDANTGKQVRKLYTQPLTSLIIPEVENGVERLTFSPDGKTLAGSSTDNKVVLWDTATGRLRRSLTMPGYNGTGPVAFHPDNRTIATASNPRYASEEDEAICLFDHLNGKELGKLTGIAEVPSTLAYSADGHYLLASGKQFHEDSGGLTVWDMATKKVVRGRSDSVTGAAFLPFSELIVYVTPQAIVVWEMRSDEKRLELGCPENDQVNVFAVSPDGRLLAGVCLSTGLRHVHLWDLATGATLEPLVGHDHHITALSFAENGRLVTGSADGTALVWDVNSRRAKLTRPTTDHAKAWDNLREDAAIAHRTIEGLISDANAAVRLLKAKLRPAQPLERAQVQRWLDQLDARDFAKRRSASRALEGFDFQAEPFVRVYASIAPSAEARKLAQRYLERFVSSNVVPDRLRELRAIEVLERIGTAEAKALLSELATGDPAARLTKTAKATLARMGK